MRFTYEDFEQFEQDALAAQSLKDEHFEDFVLNQHYNASDDMISYFHDFMLEHPDDWRFYLIDDLDEGGTREICIRMGYEEAIEQFENRR